LALILACLGADARLRLGLNATSLVRRGDLLCLSPVGDFRSGTWCERANPVDCADLAGTKCQR
jgi:hypothetical protein